MSKFKKHVDLTIAARNLREVVLLQMKQLYNEDLKPCHIYPSLYIWTVCIKTVKDMFKQRRRLELQ